MPATFRTAVAIALAPLATAQIDWSLTRIPTAHAGVFVHDARRGTCVLFDQGETWELDRSWLRRDPGTRPPTRSQHAMAYDPRRGVVTLFGGADATLQPFQDTWDWDGSTWHLRANSGPPARRDAALAWDPVHARLLLFGGTAGLSVLGDTWHFDGAGWSQLAPAAAPMARGGHSLATDSTRQRVVLFGGYSWNAQLNDTWEWDGTNWLPIAAATAPPARSDHSMCFDEVHQRVRLFGGLTNVGTLFIPFGDSWQWDGTNWTPLPATGPEARAYAGLCWDARRGATLLCGGVGDSWYGDVWTLQGSTWSRLFDSDPGQPIGQTACFDSTRRRVIVWTWFTTNPLSPGVGSRLFEWDGRIWREFPANQPSARSSTALAYDAARQRCVLFGGAANGMLNETWEWDGLAWSLRTTAAAPSPRWAHAMVYDTQRQRIVLFGGRTSSTFAVVNGETWEFDGANWTQRLPATSPFPRADHAMAYDPLRGRTIMFGGAATTELGDTWSWDGTNWQAVVASGPAARRMAAMTFDAVSGRILLHGGTTLQAGFHDLWDFDGQVWQLRSTATSSPDLSGHSLVPDDTNAVLAMFGARRDGNAFTFPGRIWRLGPTVPASATPGLSGCGGATQPRLLVTEPALATHLVRFDVDGIAPQTPTLLVLGDRFGATPLGGGCTQYAQGTLTTTFLLADANGLAIVRLELSGAAALRGLQFIAQGAALVPGGPLGGIALSAPVRLRIGD